MTLKRTSVFTDKLEPIKPDPEKEEAFLDKAADKAWHDRNVKSAENDVGEPKIGEKTEVGRQVAKKPITASKKPTRPAPVSALLPELVEQYTQALSAGESLPLPPNPFFQKVDRHRVYTMCPVHTAAALQAYSDAKGYNQMWMAIDDLLRGAGVYGTDGDQ